MTQSLIVYISQQVWRFTLETVPKGGLFIAAPVCRRRASGAPYLIELACFSEVDRWLSANFSIGSRALVRLKEGVRYVSAQINPLCLVDFRHIPSTIFSSVGENLTGKLAKLKPTHNWSFLEFLIQEKQILFLASDCNQELLGLA